MSVIAAIALIRVLSLFAQADQTSVHIATSDAIDYARSIARDEGYDVKRTDLYFFDVLSDFGGTQAKNYITIDFRVGTHAANLIMINNNTGQAIDYNTCEVFEYPDSKTFQKRITNLTGKLRKSAKELAAEIGCTSPKVLTTPAASVK